MEGKIESMRVLDNNPEKPVVRMANLCVVAGHTVFLFHCHVLHPVISFFIFYSPLHGSFVSVLLLDHFTLSFFLR